MRIASTCVIETACIFDSPAHDAVSACVADDSASQSNAGVSTGEAVASASWSAHRLESQRSVSGSPSDIASTAPSWIGTGIGSAGWAWVRRNELLRPLA